jgi:hypothetical protein
VVKSILEKKQADLYVSKLETGLKELVDFFGTTDHAFFDSALFKQGGKDNSSYESISKSCSPEIIFETLAKQNPCDGKRLGKTMLPYLKEALAKSLGTNKKHVFEVLKDKVINELDKKQSTEARIHNKSLMPSADGFNGCVAPEIFEIGQRAVGRRDKNKAISSLANVAGPMLDYLDANMNIPIEKAIESFVNGSSADSFDEPNLDDHFNDSLKKDPFYSRILKDRGATVAFLKMLKKSNDDGNIVNLVNQLNSPVSYLMNKDQIEMKEFSDSLVGMMKDRCDRFKNNLAGFACSEPKDDYLPEDVDILKHTLLTVDNSADLEKAGRLFCSQVKKGKEKKDSGLNFIRDLNKLQPDKLEDTYFTKDYAADLLNRQYDSFSKDFCEMDPSFKDGISFQDMLDLDGKVAADCEKLQDDYQVTEKNGEIDLFIDDPESLYRDYPKCDPNSLISKVMASYMFYCIKHRGTDQYDRLCRDSSDERSIIANTNRTGMQNAFNPDINTQRGGLLQNGRMLNDVNTKTPGTNGNRNFSDNERSPSSISTTPTLGTQSADQNSVFNPKLATTANDFNGAFDNKVESLKTDSLTDKIDNSDEVVASLSQMQNDIKALQAQNANLRATLDNARNENERLAAQKALKENENSQNSILNRLEELSKKIETQSTSKVAGPVDVPSSSYSSTPTGNYSNNSGNNQGDGRTTAGTSGSTSSTTSGGGVSGGNLIAAPGGDVGQTAATFTRTNSISRALADEGITTVNTGQGVETFIGNRKFSDGTLELSSSDVQSIMDQVKASGKEELTINIDPLGALLKFKLTDAELEIVDYTYTDPNKDPSDLLTVATNVKTEIESKLSSGSSVEDAMDSVENTDVKRKPASVPQKRDVTVEQLEDSF